MKNSQERNAFFTALAVYLESIPMNETEQNLQIKLQNLILEDEGLAMSKFSILDGFINADAEFNLYPTVKGLDALFGSTVEEVVIEKKELVTIPYKKLYPTKLLQEFTDICTEMCYRCDNHPKFKDILLKDDSLKLDTIRNSMLCIREKLHEWKSE